MMNTASSLIQPLDLISWHSPFYISLSKSPTPSEPNMTRTPRGNSYFPEASINTKSQRNTSLVANSTRWSQISVTDTPFRGHLIYYPLVPISCSFMKKSKAVSSQWKSDQVNEEKFDLMTSNHENIYLYPSNVLQYERYQVQSVKLLNNSLDSKHYVIKTLLI